jgi:hypothetical protein
MRAAGCDAPVAGRSASETAGSCEPTAAGRPSSSARADGTCHVTAAANNAPTTRCIEKTYHQSPSLPPSNALGGCPLPLTRSPSTARVPTNPRLSPDLLGPCPPRSAFGCTCPRLRRRRCGRLCAGGALAVAFKRQVPLGDRHIASSRRPCGSLWRCPNSLLRSGRVLAANPEQRLTVKIVGSDGPLGEMEKVRVFACRE